MQYTRFGSTGITVSRLGLGTATLGKISRDDADRILAAALDAGVNLVDTAESYPDSEARLGDILHKDGRRDKVFLTSKVFNQRAHGGRSPRNSRANLIASLEHSLRELKTDRIDLYQLHHPDAAVSMDETLATLDGFVKQGKVRYVGLSNHYSWQIALNVVTAQQHGWSPPVSMQCCYSLIDRPIEIETVPCCQKLGLAMITYHATTTGLLTDALALSGKPLELDDPRVRGRGHQLVKLRRAEVAGMFDTLRGVMKRQSLMAQQVAVLWQLAKPYVTTVLLGGETAEHFADIYAAADRALPAEEVKVLDEAGACFRYQAFTNQGWTDR